MEIKKDILWRVYLIYLFICVFAIAIIAKICIIQFVEGEQWKEKALALTTKEFSISAERGNIFDANGNLLATSLPFYETGMDVNTDHITDKMFNENVDSLSYHLSELFKDKSKKDYKKILTRSRNKGDRYLLIKRSVSYKQLQAMKKFPLFRLGRYKGGFIYLQTNKRERPFKVLAERTIGYDRNGKPIGLEGAYNNYLKGETGKRWMQKISGGVWMPINDDNEIEPRDGNDIISTIDINIQDVAENALLNQLVKNNAGYGCVVLMEVKTGEIKAIANLAKVDSGLYRENYNYAIGSGTVPGSTFKLPSLIALMEDYNVSLNEIVDIGNGTCYYYNDRVSDSHPPEKSRLNVQEVFEQSSNVGVTKLITKYYAKDPQKFIDRLYAMNLNSPLGIPIPGEATPYIKNTKDKSWSKTSLPWISYGYETRITPLQILNFYSAVANDGKMMRPSFVKEIRKHGKVIKSFTPEVINPAICSKATIDKAKKMLEGVVLNGTAQTLKSASYRIAGKTGTAQMGMVKGKMTYQASFVGYFPAENPKYACIVVVSAPSGDAYYGGVVAGPVFKEVADKVYASSLEIHKPVYANNSTATYAPSLKSGSNKDITKALSELKFNSKRSDEESEWVSSSGKDSLSIRLSQSNVEEKLKRSLIPDLSGMSVQDAIYLLENNGINVTITGRGAVNKQSLPAGTKFTKGTQITLELS